MLKINCSHCNYNWDTKSEKLLVTCPSCLRKTEVRKREVLKE